MGVLKSATESTSYLYVHTDKSGNEEVRVAKPGRMAWLRAHVFSRSAFNIGHIMKVLEGNDANTGKVLEAGAFKRYTADPARLIQLQSFALSHVIVPQFERALSAGDHEALDKIVTSIVENGFNLYECMRLLAQSAPRDSPQGRLFAVYAKAASRFTAAAPFMETNRNLYGLRPVDLIHLCLVAEHKLDSQSGVATSPIYVKKGSVPGLVRTIVIDPANEDILVQIKGKRKTPFRKEGALKKVTEAVLLPGPSSRGAYTKPQVLVQAVNLDTEFLESTETRLLVAFQKERNLMSARTVHERASHKEGKVGTGTKRSFFQEKGVDCESWVKTARGKGLATNREDQLAVISGIANGMRAFHRYTDDQFPEGITHNDVKPANIIMTVDGDGDLLPKISDFGMVAKATEPPGIRYGLAPMYASFVYSAPELLQNLLDTVASSLRGTDAPSPERIADTRAHDMYATGLTLYRLICARQGGTDQSLLKQFDAHMHKLRLMWTKTHNPEKCLPYLQKAIAVQQRIGARAATLAAREAAGKALTPQETINYQIYRLLVVDPKERPNAESFAAAAEAFT